MAGFARLQVGQPLPAPPKPPAAEAERVDLQAPTSPLAPPSSREPQRFFRAGTFLEPVFGPNAHGLCAFTEQTRVIPTKQKPFSQWLKTEPYCSAFACCPAGGRPALGHRGCQRRPVAGPEAARQPLLPGAGTPSAQSPHGTPRASDNPGGVCLLSEEATPKHGRAASPPTHARANAVLLTADPEARARTLRPGPLPAL